MKCFEILALVVCLYAFVALTSSAPTPSTRVKRGLTEDAEKLLRQASQVDVNNVGQLIDLVERNKAEQCLYRVICELSHNTRAYGDSGAKFARSLLKFQQNNHPKIQKYKDAMMMGAKAKNNNQCKSHYSQCTHSTDEVITAGNKLLKSK